jgi:hypothetical protein
MPPAPAQPRLRTALTARGRQLRTRTIVERDYRSFRRRYGDILGRVPPKLEGTALVASLTHSIFQLKLEGMLAKAFQLQGLEPVAVVPWGTAVPRRYLELFGVRRFVTLEDFLPEDVDAAAAAEADALLADVATTGDLRPVTFRGAGVGRQALSTASRHLHEGAVDAADPDAREQIRRFLALAIRTTMAADGLLDAVEPELVIFNEMNYAAEGPLSDLALARGLNTIQFVGGYDDDALVFKRYTAETKGLHPRSLSEESWQAVREMPWTPERDRELDAEFARRYEGSSILAQLNRGWTREQSRAEIVRSVGLDPGRKTAVVFSHILWDANMFYGRDLFPDQEAWFVETVRAACANPNVNWIVKLHPAQVWKLKRDGATGELDELAAIREQIGELPPHVHVLEPTSDISPWSLFELTDFGITIRGSVGFELPCFGIPALTAGTGFYSGRGFTVDSESADAYLARLRRIEETPPPTPQQVEVARRHAYALFRLRQTRFTSFRSIYQPLEKIDRPFEATIELTVRSADELERAEDLRRFGEWAVDPSSLDYLDPVPA